MSSRIWSVGVNYTSSDQVQTIDDMIASGYAHHVEVLIDNFLTVPATSILEKFGDTPVAFHIMYSRFLEADRDHLQSMAARLRTLIRDVKPIYVSDHVGCFSYEGRAMPILGEYDYRRLEHALCAIEQWQELLGTRLILENFPSYTSEGAAQPDFYQRIADRTGAGLLFDISNAVVAANNAGVPLEAWSGLLDQCDSFHLGGYSEAKDGDGMLLDTHDGPLSDDTMAAACRIFSQERERPVTLTVEFDRNIDAVAWSRDLRWAAGLNPLNAIQD